MLADIDGVVPLVVGRRGEAPLVPPYKTLRRSWGSYFVCVFQVPEVSRQQTNCYKLFVEKLADR